MKWLDNITWPKAALFTAVAMLVVGVFSPATVDRVIDAIINVTQILANAAGNLGGAP